MKRYDMLNWLSLFCFLCVCTMGVTDIVLNIDAQSRNDPQEFVQQLNELEYRVETLEEQNKELQQKIYELEGEFYYYEVEDTLYGLADLTDEEVELLNKVVAWFCTDSPVATKTYVGYTVINLMLERNITISEAITVLGVNESNLNGIVYSSTDEAAVAKVLNSTMEEAEDRSCGATFFCETENYEKYALNDMQVLFTSGNYTFMRELTVG